MEEMNKNSLKYNYLAFDILPMSSPARIEGVRLAVVLKLADGTIKEYSSVTRNKLISIIKPDLSNEGYEEIILTADFL